MPGLAGFLSDLGFRASAKGGIEGGGEAGWNNSERKAHSCGGWTIQFRRETACFWITRDGPDLVNNSELWGSE
jgi:hypothetical protein